ncbi:ATP-binding protein [Comamonas sp. lk]|uniref:ATP-binding protein n=1 Tax=Comamonas sp. lk TaxID=2201272 RepID=UPI0013CF2E98|nr:ATP-binding protein [Comamonas sp. lk]
MKKISRGRLDWLIRRQRALLKKDKRFCGYITAKKNRVMVSRAVLLSPIVRTAPVHLKYYAPPGQRRETESFFEKINNHLLNGKSVKIDFRKLEHLYPCGVLILMGWVDEWVKKYPKKVSANYPSVDLVEQMLSHVGVLGKLGLETRKESSHSDVLRWHYLHQNDNNSQVEENTSSMENFFLELRSILGEEKQIELGGCISEAMVNVGNHAYQTGDSKPWWIFSTVSENNIFIALHDRGLTIPKTVRQKPKVQEVLLGVRSKDTARADVELITAAVGGRTRTGLPYRGRGLSEMLQFTKKYKNSELGIMSNRGMYRYHGEQHTAHLGNRLNGTLIIWIIKFPKDEK